MEIINATPHPISIYDADTPDTLPTADAPAPLRTIAPSGTLARAAQTRAAVGELDDVLVGTSVFGAVEGLPAPVAGVWYIVSGLVLSAVADRPDLLAPARPVRDEAGRVIGCREWDTTPAGAAALTAADAPPTADAPIAAWQDAEGRTFRLFTVADGSITAGAKVVDRNGQAAVVVGEKGRGRREFVLPVRGAQQGDTVLSARVILTPSGGAALEVADAANAETGYAMVVFRTTIGFRGGNEHTGDYDKSAGVKADWPGVDFGEGRIAQGDAGGMGSGDQPISLLPQGEVARVARTGRLYGATGTYYFLWTGNILERATRDERAAALDGVWAQHPVK